MSNDGQEYTFGMVRIHSDPTKLADKRKPARRPAEGDPEDLLFVDVSGPSELETPFSEGGAGPAGAEVADSPWEEGAESVIELLDNPPPRAAAPAQQPNASAARPRLAVMRLTEPAPQKGPAKPASKTGTGGRPRPTRSSYLLSVSVLASGLGCAALMWLGLGTIPLAIVSAALGILGAVFAYVLGSR